VEPYTGRQWLHLLPDAVNDLETSESVIAPTLQITGIVSLSSTAAVVTVASLGESTVALTTAHQAIWQDLATATARVRVVNPTSHNPVTERAGWLEGSATVAAVYDSPAAISLTLSTSWARGDYTWADILAVGSFICLTDRRPAGGNAEGVEISPLPEQLYNSSSGDDFAKWAPSGSTLPFDGHYSKIAT
jgi:hypothetical protein